MAVVNFEWIQQAAGLVAYPVVAPFLLCLGFLGLLAELRTPRFGLAGTAGLLALALFFASHAVTGLASVGDILLFAVGLVLFGLEIFVIPGFGFVGVLGGAGILAGIYLSLLGPNPNAAALVRAGLVLAGSAGLAFMAAWVLLRSLPAHARPGSHGIFLPHRSGVSNTLASEGRYPGPLAREGSAITDLSPSGTALFGEERIEVVSESEPIPAGTPVRIVATGGYRRVVRRTEETGKGGWEPPGRPPDGVKGR